MVTGYAFSEAVTASTYSRWHISPVEDGQLKLGGNAPAPICGFDWGNGWHLNDYVTVEKLDDHVCRGCTIAFGKIGTA